MSDCAPETWRDVPGYESRYQVSDQGRVRSVARFVNQGNRWGALRQRFVPGQVLRNTMNGTGYLQISLGRDGKKHSVHKLVLLAFVGPCPRAHECAHGDGDRTNNTLGNLRWATRIDNHNDKRKHGTTAKGESNPNAKLTDGTVKLIRCGSASGATQRALARRFGISQQAVSRVLCGKAWAHV